MLISPQYEGFYGSIGRVGKSSVQTLFYHLFGFPIWPQETYWVTGGPFTRLENTKVMEIERSIPSIISGYLRGWTAAGAFYLLCVGLFLAIVVEEPLFPGDPLFFGRTILGVVTIALAMLAAVFAVAVWVFTRFPVSADELARRAVFAQWIGTAVDPALLDKPWSQRDDLKRAIGDIAERLGMGRAGFGHWREIALRPDVQIAELLGMAMTVARLSRAAPAEGDEPAELARTEDAIWQKLCQLNPQARSARPA